MRITELASRVGARLENCSEELDITGVAPIEEAEAGQIALVVSARDWAAAKTTRASALIVPSEYPAVPVPLVRDEDPYLIFARVVDLFHAPPAYEPGIHRTAVIHETASVGPGASIGAYVVIDQDVEIGARAVLLPHVVIYRGARIGRNFFAHAHAVVREYCRLGDNVILQNGAVIGADGFGFARETRDGRAMWKKVVHPGAAVLGDEVEVQANACVDRSDVGETRVGRGAKIGALALVGHEASVGEQSIVSPQVGLAGAVRVGKDVVLLGQVAVADYVTIGDRVVVTGKAGVINDVGAGQVVSGYPATDHRRWLRCVAVFKRLPELTRKPLPFREDQPGENGNSSSLDRS
jgi:UDP-3-O-[3-hydroxymyristoyl] glucosamine N-acyltransferase